MKSLYQTLARKVVTPLLIGTIGLTSILGLGCKRQVRSSPSGLKIEDMIKDFENYNVRAFNYGESSSGPTHKGVYFDDKNDENVIEFGDKWKLINSPEELREYVNKMKVQHDLKDEYVGKMKLSTGDVAGYGFSTFSPWAEQDEKNPRKFNIFNPTHKDFNSSNQGGGAGSAGSDGPGSSGTGGATGTGGDICGGDAY